MKNLKHLRENLNLTQKQLAEKLDIVQQTYCRYENMQTQPDLETMIKIAEFFNVSLDYLCGRRFNNPVGYIQDDKKETVNILLSLDHTNFEKAKSYMQGLID